MNGVLKNNPNEWICHALKKKHRRKLTWNLKKATWKWFEPFPNHTSPNSEFLNFPVRLFSAKWWHHFECVNFHKISQMLDEIKLQAKRVDKSNLEDFGHDLPEK